VLAILLSILGLCLVMSLAGWHPFARAPVMPHAQDGALATGTGAHQVSGTVSATVPPGTNIVAANFGGEIESMTGTCGPGLTGRRLLDSSPDTTWVAEAETMTSDRVTLPYEIVFSFYKRDAASVVAVVLTLGEKSKTSPKDVEVWTSMDHPSDGFSEVAAATLQPQPGVQAISFPPVEARYVKLRVLSVVDADSEGLEIDGVQVIEGSQPGYQTLLARNPDIPNWKTSVRHAAQLGIEWLQPSAVQWQKSTGCFGCHVQSQVLMGLAVAQTNGYVVSQNCMTDLANFTRTKQAEDGTEQFDQPLPATSTTFAAMGIAYFDELTGAKHDPVFLKYVDWLAAHQDRTGALVGDFDEPPIAQGSLMSTGNAVVAFMQAFLQVGDPRYQHAADRAISFVALTKPETTQDKLFQIFTLSRFGTPEQRQAAARLVAQLQSEQGADGGWRETATMEGSNAFATGQVLYALKAGGVSTNSPGFIKGVRYLLDSQQKDTGAWPSENTQSRRSSDFAPTMWAVIGLAGTFASVAEPTAASLKAELDKNGRIILYINFDFNRATIRPDGKPIIDQVLKLLKDYPDLELSVTGHTDNMGLHDYNVKLSEARAAAVVDALVTAGIPRNRLSSAGAGPDSPIADNNTEEGRAKNRRVELIKR
jgi:outer membrane protein OmpA-like peptidoglycan-associated protein